MLRLRNTVVVTSLIIGVFLLFLAFGYYRGGYHKNNYRLTLIKNFIFAGLILAVGLSYTFIDWFFISGQSWLQINSFYMLLIYLLLIVAPIVYLLGQTVPISSNLFVYKDHVGTVSGKVLFLSTLGSFLGAVLTTLVLMNTIGVADTIVFNILCLVLLILFLTYGMKNMTFGTVIGLVCLVLIFLVVNLNSRYENKHFIAANAYANYSVKYYFDSRDKK